jgi:hypothetical protein
VHSGLELRSVSANDVGKVEACASGGTRNHASPG